MEHLCKSHLVTVIAANVILMDWLASKRSANATYKRSGEGKNSLKWKPSSYEH